MKKQIDKTKVEGMAVKKGSPSDLEIKVEVGGKEYKVSDQPSFLGTKELLLTRRKPIQAVNMFLPPGVSKFYVEKTDSHHRVKIRFLIATEEVERLADKAEEMMGEKKGKEAPKKNESLQSQNKNESLQTTKPKGEA
jgi:hypothetical protein